MQHLTESEVQIMKCMWDANEQLALSDILKRVNERYNRGWKPQTASTFVARLVQKGFLRLDRSVRYYSYEILIPEADYLKEEVIQFSDFWGVNSATNFVSNLLEANRLSKDEAQEIMNKLQSFVE